MPPEIIAFWAVCGILGGFISSSRGGGFGIGLVLGGLFGPLGVLAAFAVKGAPAPTAPVRECPHCKESMRRDASVCPHCQRESPAWTFHEGRWWAKTAEGEWRVLGPDNATWEIPARPEATE